MKYNFCITFEREMDNFGNIEKELFQNRLKDFLGISSITLTSSAKSEVVDFLDSFFDIIKQESDIIGFKLTGYEDYSMLEDICNQYNLKCKLVEKFIPDYSDDGYREVEYIYSFQLGTDTKYIKFSSYEESWGELSFYRPVFVTKTEKMITVYE